MCPYGFGVSRYMCTMGWGKALLFGHAAPKQTVVNGVSLSEEAEGKGEIQT